MGDDHALIDTIERTKARTLTDLIDSNPNFSSGRNLTVFKTNLPEKNVLNRLRSSRSTPIFLNASHTESDLIETEASKTFFRVTPDALLTGNKSRALVLYYMSEKHLVSALIMPHKIFVNKQKLKGDISKTIAALYEGSRNIVFKKNKKILTRLNRILMKNLLPNLSGIKELVIIPHGPLHSLPFEALFDGHQYLIQRFAISYAPSVKLYSHFLNRKFSDTQHRILAFGNPAYPIPQKNLPEAEEEVKAISNKLAASAPLIGADATETYFRENAKNASIIHLATHGKFDRNQPMNSYVLLSEDRKNDGFVHAFDLFELELNQTRLFVFASRRIFTAT